MNTDGFISIVDGYDTDMLGNCTQMREHGENDNKNHIDDEKPITGDKISNDPLGANNAPLAQAEAAAKESAERVFSGVMVNHQSKDLMTNCLININNNLLNMNNILLKAQENYGSNNCLKTIQQEQVHLIEAQRTIDKLAHQRNQVAGVEKSGGKSFEVLSWEPRVFLFHNFLSKNEYEHLIQLAKPYFASSHMSFEATIERRHDEIVKNIEQRIAETTYLPVELGGQLSVLRHEVGQKFKPRHDYICNMSSTQNGGQHIATFLMYLSPAEEGGEIIFPLAKGNITTVPWCEGSSQQFRSGVVVKPKAGDAVFIWNVKPDGTSDQSSLHSGFPVIKGSQWCCTKSFHGSVYKAFNSYRCMTNKRFLAQNASLGPTLAQVSTEALSKIKMILGGLLFPFVHQLEYYHAPKVTGMLLELDLTEILILLESPVALKARVVQAMQVLRNAHIG